MDAWWVLVCGHFLAQYSSIQTVLFVVWYCSPALLCGVYHVCYTVQYGPALMALPEHCTFPFVDVFASSRCFTLQPALMKNNSTASKYIQPQKERGVVCCSIRGCYLLKSYDSQGMIDFTLNPTTDLFFCFPTSPQHFWQTPFQGALTTAQIPSWCKYPVRNTPALTLTAHK